LIESNVTIHHIAFTTCPLLDRLTLQQAHNNIQFDFMMVSEQELLQLPPALRMAAKSGRGRKQKKHDDRMSLKNEAKAMRLRLAQMADKTEDVLAADSLRVDDNATSPTLVVEAENRDSSGKNYSAEVLNKKIRKVEKMIDKSTPGSKEIKVLQKKLIDYRSQLKQQKRQTGTRLRLDRSYSPSEIRGKESAEEQQQGSVHSDTFSAEKVAEKEVDTNRIESKVNKQEHTNVHSLEMLKRKMRKVEKMLQKSTPGSKEYKKLQKKQMDYERQIREQDSSRFTTEDKKYEKRVQQLEKADIVRLDAIPYQNRLSWERASEKKEKDPKQTAEIGNNEGVKQQKDPSLRSGINTAENGKMEDLKSKPSQVKNITHYEQDEKLRKQAYLEEARKLRQEALAKRRKEEESLKKTEVEVVEDVTTKNPTPRLSRTEVAEHKHSEAITASNGAFVDEDYQKRKQAYLEEARRLKQEAEERKRNKRLLEKAEVEDEKVVNNKSYDLGIQSKNLKEDDASRKKQAYLEEARRLKQEAMRQKSKDAEQAVERQREDETLNKVDSVDEECMKETASIGETSLTDRMDDELLKSDTLNNSQSDIREKKEEEQHNDSTSSIDQNSVSNVDERTPMLLEDIKSRAEKEKEIEHPEEEVNDEETGNSNLLTGAVKSNECKQQNDATSFSGSVQRTKKPSFLEQIKLRTKRAKKVKQQDISTPCTDPDPRRLKPNLLDEIETKANGNKENERQKNNIAASSKPDQHKRGHNFLEAIKSRAGGQKKDKETDDSIPSNKNAKKPNFLEEIRAKAEKQNETKENISDSSSDSGMSGKNSNAESMESSVQQSEHSEKPGTEKVQFQTRAETLATDTNQQGEVSKVYLDRRSLPEPFSNNTKKILRALENNEIRQKKLEKSLIQNGIRPFEDISYEEAKDKIADITDSMKALTTAGLDSYTMEKEYFRLEEQLSKYTAALMLTDEYAEEHRRMEQDWERSIENDNIAAICKLRSHMPVNIRHLTEAELTTVATPNGKTLPKAIARKFKRTNILQLLRVDPDDIEKMHPSLLEGMRTTGLTLTERRALHEHFRDVVGRWTEKRSDPSIEKKWQWYQTLRSKFKETLSAYLRCIEQFGPPGSHQYAKRGDPNGGGCTLLGNQCPIKADAAIDYSDDYGYTKEAVYENSGNRSDPKKKSPREISVSNEKSSKITTSSEEETMQNYRDHLRLDADETEVDKKLLRELFHSDKRTKTLEKQLTQAGLSLPKEDISYDMAKTRVAELTEELNKVAVNMGSTSDAKQLAKLEHTFGTLSQDLDKYTNALMLTKEWAKEQKDKEHKWESDISAANYEALQKVRRHMPVNIRNVSETTLATDLTPNGKVLPKAIAKKFKRTNILMILRTDPSVIEAMHPSSLESMRTTGLTLTERRAIHEHMKEIAPKWKAMTSDKMCERKWMWHASLQSKLKEMLEKYDKHVEQYGPPGNHPYRKRNDPNGVGCPLIGNQCPIKADLVIDYSGDYGFPDTAEYEQQTVAKSNLLSMDELEKRRLEDDYN